MLTELPGKTATSVIAIVTGAVTATSLAGAVLIISTMASASSACQALPSEQPSTSAEARDDIPVDLLSLYMAAGRKYEIPWNVLAAIGKIESDHGRTPGVGVRHGSNYAGAAGPMQIGIGGAAGNEWGRFGVDGNGDSRKDVYDPEDAIPGAAQILIEDKGYRKNAREAVRRYNGSGPQAQAYADKAMRLADKYASGGFSVGSPAYSSRGCTQAMSNGFAAPKGLNARGDWPPETPGAENITPRTHRMRNAIKQSFGVPKGIGCYRAGPDAQDHGQGRACDFMISSGSPNAKQVQLGFAIANWATSHAVQLGIHYVIFRQHIWNIDRSAEGWRPMENRGGVTANHFDHVHVSMF